jgi:colanic acid/amylovoran biosynthesis glycosyltransferase
MKVAYLLHRFPSLTETFVLLEMGHIRPHVEQVSVYSLMAPKHKTVHERAKEWLSLAHYSHFLSWGVIRANLHYLQRMPRRYARAWWRMLAQTYHEPAVALLCLALFPKSVFFARQMEEEQIDHIHAHFVWLGGIAAGVIAELLDIPFTLHAHAFDIFQRNQENVRHELENATAVVTISTYHHAYLAKLCPSINAEKLHIVHLGVDTKHFCPAEHTSSQKPTYEPVNILSVGRLIEKKGHPVLVDACWELAVRGIDFRCRIVGDGPLHTELAKRIEGYGLQDKVILCGALTQERVLELHQTADIFALPAIVARSGDQDGMPFVLIEAMACGVPVVTSPIAGIPDLVKDSENGILVRQQDVLGLADALQSLAADPNQRHRLGQAARQTVLQEFQIQQNAAKLAALFEEIARRQHGHEANIQWAKMAY